MELPYPDLYTTRSDDSLIELARLKDGRAIDCIVWRYTPLVRARAAAYLRPGLELEDLMQEGMIGLLAAVRVYKSTSASFSSFARLCVDRVLIGLLRAQNRKRRVPYYTMTDLSDETQKPCGRLDPEQILISREEYARFWDKLTDKLSPLEYRVLSASLRTGTNGEAARELGISPKSVDNALQRIRRKLEQKDNKS